MIENPIMNYFHRGILFLVGICPFGCLLRCGALFGGSLGVAVKTHLLLDATIINPAEFRKQDADLPENWIDDHAEECYGD